MVKTAPRGLASVLLTVWLFASVPTVVSHQNPSAKTESATVLSPQELFSRLSRSVFIVEVLDKNGSLIAIGSAVAVTPDQVVTNKHVIEDGMTLRITQGNKTWPVAITYVDPDHDLCRLTAEGLKAPVVPIRHSSTLAVGERVYAIGAPEGLELTISEGLISGLRVFEQTQLIQTSAAISPGSSGGGLFDAEGRLVGITTFFFKEGQNLNFALPGDWVKSLAAHRVSLEEKNKTTNSYFEALSSFQLGYQLMQANEYEKAVTAFREVVRLKPGETSGWYNLGVAYDSLQRDDEAKRAYEEAIRLEPDNANAWGNLGVADVHLRQYAEAIHAIQEAIRLRPTDVLDWVNLGVAHAHLSQTDEAIHAFQEAIRLKPDSAKAWYGLGMLYYKQGNRSEVMRVYEELKTLDQGLADDLFQQASSLP
jgi:Flp pilus assembly protein TadD